ncbi:hypothetical protein PVK06_023605 [Gossypium arboreum]|uniref:Uncharacterized protein n=1 Tax=Gossypium arboreum TaxID=29729 RepID=A0ABR0PBL8_GOSAR|nr:hypothetical protein PVK06_023605 [Gossypium arboreum]
MPLLVSEFQNAFVQCCLIFDNIIFTSEILYTIKRKTNGKGSFVAFKIDIVRIADPSLVSALIRICDLHKLDLGAFPLDPTQAPLHRTRASLITGDPCSDWTLSLSVVHDL